MKSDKQFTEKAWYQALQHVSRPARYIGGEMNQVIKGNYRIHFCLAFPDIYEIGMSHLGLRILYHYLNRETDIFAERVFAPWPDLEKELRSRGIPLVSLETKTPLRDFDAIGFSLQYQLEYTNVLTMLDLASMPVFSHERGEDAPFIIAGGPQVFNPEPVADFFDIMVIGDGENILPSLLRELSDLRGKGLSRREILQALSPMPGLYIPSLATLERFSGTGQLIVKDYKRQPFPIPKNLLPDLDKYPFPADIIVPHTDIVHNRISVEIARGCTQGCRFCQAGFIYRPVRERSPQSIFQTITDSIQSTGYREVSLTSLSPADFSSIGDLVTYLVSYYAPQQISFHLSSLRVYGLSRQITEELSKQRKTGFTIAPEAGTQRMRDVINKNITEEDIFTGARNAFENGWELIKLYTMIGLPFETMEDVEGIADLAIRLLKLGESIIGKRARINLSVSTFVPQPFTPFQWVPFISEEEFNRKRDLLFQRLKPYKRIKFDFNDYFTSWLEALHARGDRQLSQVIYHAWKKGTRLDAWREHIRRDAWEEAVSRFLPEFLPQLQGYSPTDPFPWDHIDSGVKKAFLLKEFQRAEKVRVTIPCEQPAVKEFFAKKQAIFHEKPYVCYQCGLNCNLPELREKQKQELKFLEEAIRHIEQSHSEKKNEETTYLFRFEKKAPLHLLSHLNIMQVIVRLFQRIGHPVAFSLGMNPKPRLSLGRALALGVESLDEWGLVTLQKHADPELLKNLLNQAAPAGMRFLLMTIPRGKISFHEFFHYHSFQLTVPGNVLPFHRMEEKIVSYLQQDTVLSSEADGKKSRNMKEFVRILQYRQDADGNTRLEIEWYSPPSGTVKLSDFLVTVFGIESTEIQIVKTSSLPAPVPEDVLHESD